MFVWQICDFGLAKWKAYSQSRTESRSKRKGTVTHTPPEIWNDINHPRTVKYDVYGFAVLFWELITEKEPFKNGIMLLPLLYAGMTCQLSCVFILFSLLKS